MRFEDKLVEVTMAVQDGGAHGNRCSYPAGGTYEPRPMATSAPATAAVRRRRKPRPACVQGDAAPEKAPASCCERLAIVQEGLTAGFRGDPALPAHAPRPPAPAARSGAAKGKPP
jgi:hypothetical protein